jgi:NitT/TauT family transport system substrate-binding protein
MSSRGMSLISGLLALLVVACASGAPSARPAAPVPTTSAPAASPAAGATAAPVAVAQLRIAAVNPVALYWPLYVATEQGYFREQAIELEIVYTSSPVRSTQLVVVSEVELGTIGADTAVESIYKGADLRIVGGGARTPNFMLFTPPDVRQYSDLRGKTLAVVGLNLADAVFLRRLLERHGLRSDDYDLLAIGGTAERYAALKSGAIAGTLLLQPFDFQAQDDGLNRLGSSYDVIRDYQFVTTTVRREWAEQNRPVLVRFLKAVRAADQWLYDPQNESRAVDILVQSINTREDYARRSYNLYYKETRSMAEGGEISIPGMENVIKVMGEQSRLEEPLPPVDRFVDTSYWRAAAGQ